MQLPQLILTSLPEVRAHIAHTILGTPPPQVTLGNISLYPHQTEALSRIQSALQRFHGALLCDDTGLGKTYVALALAHAYAHTLIVAPANLKGMWTQAYASLYKRSTHTFSFVSMESLSSKPYHSRHNLLIVDEAHHARNAKTTRYSNLATLCRNSPVLLMSATPIHNSPNDLTTLLSLFLQDDAGSLTPDELSHILIRRTPPQTSLPHKLPIRTPTHWIVSPTKHSLLPRLLALPPPFPFQNTHTPTHLVTRSLVRQWCSSEYALSTAIRRRITQATALIATLESNRYPSSHQIRAWIFSDNTIQLAFPELTEISGSNLHAIQHNHSIESLHAIITTHKNALETLLPQIQTPSPTDIQKANTLLQIRRDHPNATIIAFSHSADTIVTLFRYLKHDNHVAALTGKCGHIVTGTLSRTEIIRRFSPQANHSPRPHTRDAITLLLTTDILSEGVNLQDASVIVHLDIPWTAATLNQRIGRVARIGSHHQTIKVYGFLPPPEADALLNTTAIIQRKARITQLTLGGPHTDILTPSQPQLLPEPSSDSRQRSTPEYTEAIRTILKSWRHSDSPAQLTSPQTCLAATTPAQTHGLIAACQLGSTPLLVATTPNGSLSKNPADIYRVLHAIQSATSNSTTPQPHTRYHPPLKALFDWHSHLQASADAGLTRLLPPHHPSTRRKRTRARQLSQELSSAPWSERHAIALRAATNSAFHPTSNPPTLTFHVIALLLLQPLD